LCETVLAGTVDLLKNGTAQLIRNQSNWGGKDFRFQRLGERIILENLFWDLFGQAGASMPYGSERGETSGEGGVRLGGKS